MPVMKRAQQAAPPQQAPAGPPAGAPPPAAPPQMPPQAQQAPMAGGQTIAGEQIIMSQMENAVQFAEANGSLPPDFNPQMAEQFIQMFGPKHPLVQRLKAAMQGAAAAQQSQPQMEGM